MITTVITFALFLIICGIYLLYLRIDEKLKKLKDWQDGVVRFGFRPKYIEGDKIQYRSMDGSLQEGVITSIHNNHVGLTYYWVSLNERVLENQIIKLI
jgi:hypothetical protein